MSSGRNWAGFVCAGLAIALGGCSATPGDESSEFDGAESVGSSVQAVNETGPDRQAAALTVRGDTANSPFALVIYICNSSHQLMRNQLLGYRTSTPTWHGWKRMGTKTCASTPTAMVWTKNLSTVGLPPGTPANHVVNAYWRDDNDQLWEHRLKEDGVNTKTTNLSSLLGLGPITGAPVVANVRDTAGIPNAVSIAVRMRDTNELYTVDYFNGSWSVLPVLVGTEVSTGSGSIVATYGYEKPMMSVQYGTGAHFVYTRPAWGQSFQRHAYTAHAPAQAPKGVLSIGGMNTAPPELTGCLPNGCAMYRNPADNQLMWVPLSFEGLLNPQVKYGYVNSWQQNPNSLKPMNGSLWFDAANPQDLQAYSRGPNSRLLQFAWGVGDWKSQACTKGLMTSAPTVFDRQVVYAGVGGIVHHMNLAYNLGCMDGNGGPTPLDLEQQVLPE